jgi:hypothetical protein
LKGIFWITCPCQSVYYFTGCQGKAGYPNSVFLFLKKINMEKEDFEYEYQKKVMRPRYRIHTIDYFNENPLLSDEDKRATIKEQKDCDDLVIGFISVHEGCSAWALNEAWSHYINRVGAPSWFSQSVALNWAFAISRGEDSDIIKWKNRHWSLEEDDNLSSHMYYFGTKEFWDEDKKQKTNEDNKEQQ